MNHTVCKFYLPQGGMISVAVDVAYANDRIHAEYALCRGFESALKTHKDDSEQSIKLIEQNIRLRRQILELGAIPCE